MAKIWNVANGTEILTLDRSARTITSVAFSPDGEFLATGHRDGVARLWDYGSGMVLKMIPAKGPGDPFGGGEGHWQVVSSLGFSVDSKLLATGSHDTKVIVWDVTKGTEVKTLEHRVNVGSVCFSPDGKQLATGSMDGTVVLWEVGSWRELHRFKGKYDRPTMIDVQFSPDSKFMLVCDDDRISLIQVATKAVVGTYEHWGGACFSPDGKQFAHTASESDVQIRNLESGEESQILPGHEGRPGCLAFSPNGKYLTVGNLRNGVIKVWDLTSVFANASALNEEVNRGRWQGKIVMPKPNAEFYDQTKVVPVWRQRLPMKVLRVEGDWVWTERAKVKLDSVILREDAAAYYDRYLSENPGSSLAHALSSAIYLQNEEYDKALEAQSKALELNSDSVLAPSLRGDVWAEKADFGKAIRDYSLAVERDPEFASAYFRRGLALIEAGDEQKALDNLTSCIDRDEEFFAAYHERGKILLRRGHPKDALVDFDNSLAKKPKQIETLVDRAKAWLALNNPQKALFDCNEVLRLDTDFGAAYKVRGRAYALMGEDAKSQSDAKEAFRLSTDNPFHYAKRPILHFDMAKSIFGSKVVTIARQPDGTNLKTFRRAPGAVWQPSGNWMAYFSDPSKNGQQSVMLTNMKGETKKLYTTTKDQMLDWHPAWSPSGDRLAFISIQLSEEESTEPESSSCTIVIVNSKDGRIEETHKIPDGVLSPMPVTPSNAFKWSPNGKHILVSWQKTVVIDLTKDRVIKISDGYSVPEWTPDGDSLFYFDFVDGDAHLGDFSGLYRRRMSQKTSELIADSAELKKANILKHPGMFSAQLKLSTTGRYLAVVVGTDHEYAQTGNLRIFQLNDDSSFDLASPAYNLIFDDRLLIQMQWSPDDTHIAALMMHDWNKLTLETLKLSTGEWNELAELNFKLRDLGVGALDFIGWHKTLSWSN